MTRRKPMTLAARVAAEVMGWEVCRDKDCWGCDSQVYYLDGEWIARDPRTGETWDPVADPADLLDVLDYFVSRVWSVEINIDRTLTPHDASVEVRAIVDHHPGILMAFEQARAVRGDWRKALARAVCKAAITAAKKEGGSDA